MNGQMGFPMAWLPAAVLLLCGASGSSAREAEEKPNIVFIFADDQCFSTLRALGSDEVETPNLDRLVDSGVTFTHAYNQGSWTGAVCVASRTMLNTGRFLWYAKSVSRQAEKERAAGRFWPEYMKKAGYDTYMTGKWHVRADPSRAFDHLKNVRGGMPKQTPQGYNRPIEGQPDPWSPYDPKIEKVLLFNVKEDPWEIHDLAEQPENKPLIKSLFARLLELQKETADTLELKTVYRDLL